MVQTCQQLVSAVDTVKVGTITIVRNSYTVSVRRGFQSKHVWGNPYYFDQQKVFCRPLCSGVGKHISIGWKMQGLLCLAGFRSSGKCFVPLNQETLQDNTMMVWCTTLAVSLQLNQTSGTFVWLSGQMLMCSACIIEKSYPLKEDAYLCTACWCGPW